MAHALESNEAERDYFERANKHGKAVWRRIVRVTTGGLPSWAEVVTRAKVVTPAEVVTRAEALPDATDDDLNAALGFA
ncbi:hypothetical protein [Burkholderia stagnalis]|uniref:hypothetical protein n=1 Tax=Burkholderia stagnalis TaxID=1503054 RepID=UPI000A3DB6C5|nr:hypothetical protein [Burkholderia stagnalis]